MTAKVLRHLNYANVAATLALLVALGGTAAAATTVIIHRNGEVASNTISGHHPPAGAHSNMMAGSISTVDLASSLRSSLKVHCPAGMQKGFDLCLDSSDHDTASWLTALKTCASAGKRLPSAGELAEIFEFTGAPWGPLWTDTAVNDNNPFQAMTLSVNASRAISLTRTSSELVAYRCVAGLRN
jgi:hypothetical protein